MRCHILGLAFLSACTATVSSPDPSTQRVAVAAPRGAGRVAEGQFPSAALGVTKHYRIYLPAGYDASATRFPVLYYLHGLGGNESDWLEGGYLAQTADRLGLRAIVVMPDGDASFYANSTTPSDYDACLREADHRAFGHNEPPSAYCVRTPRYEDYLTHDLLAHIDATYRTVATRQGRGIAGLSMGGFGAFMIAMRHPDLYAAAASHSGVVALLYAGPHPYQRDQVRLVEDVRRWGLRFEEISAQVRSIFGPDLANWRAHDPATLAAKIPSGKLELYLDCGTEDEFGLEDAAAYLHDVLLRAGVPHEFALLPGRHNFQFWTPRLAASLAFFAKHLQMP